ncbi:MAG: Carbamoyltransferase HypF [Syntrophorhabdus sp. PtaU1.Bin153]|nr:MAG: Carbamoyltransferase HypF [Syntrophorhabdus sp. PtaU1.Bin153]
MSDERNDIVHRRIVIKGTVQGVGFRPHVYHLATIHGIKGTVLNSSRGVVIEVEASEKSVQVFLQDLAKHPPPLARIDNIDVSELPPASFQTFEILASAPSSEAEALVPPDVAMCRDCRNDIANPKDNHYRYPFTNCTNCGPRFTIIKEIPYDRPKTSMAGFAMCESCRTEYKDPANRRFHAQPVACPTCGPHVVIADRSGSMIADGNTWLTETWHFLAAGNILALKGIGGFHLVCDAKNQTAVETLRARKGRKTKPFALMCRNLDAVKAYCVINKKEAELLTSPEAPIVILAKKTGCPLPEGLAPGLTSLGIMLPYSPLHLLLFNGPFDVLVMTSGNSTGLPLAKDNEDALAELGTIADYFVFHNRDIVNRCDDSLVQVIDGETHFFRRSRGYVPRPFQIQRDHGSPVVLGVGGEMKNTFCLLKGDQAFASPYIGEIDTVEGEENLLESLLRFQSLMGVEPDIVAFDAHPGYASARIAQKIHADAYEEVYHHHAHLAGVMADNNLENKKTIGVILDGTGYGTDGHLWGFEVLLGDYAEFDRLYHLAYVPLPGAEAAIRQPWRTAIAYLRTFLGTKGGEYARMLFADKKIGFVEQMVANRFNSPLSSGCGRLFDAVSAILGVCFENTYEGQAAIELGELVAGMPPESTYEPYEYEIEDHVILPHGILDGIIRDRLHGVPIDIISGRFHQTLVTIICDLAGRSSSQTGLRQIALSGGTWQNTYLFRAAKRALNAQGFEVLYHRHVPANDGGIALGQAMTAHWRWRNRQAGSDFLQ